jgi:hypothetical protein
VSCPQCAANPQSASPLFQYERRGAPRLPGCPQLCMQKSHPDRQVRRVRIGASCPPVATEHLFDLFIGRQIAPRSARLDDLPFLFADVIVRTPCSTSRTKRTTFSWSSGAQLSTRSRTAFTSSFFIWDILTYCLFSAQSARHRRHQTTAQPRAPPASPLLKSVSHPAPNSHAPRLQFSCSRPTKS